MEEPGREAGVGEADRLESLMARTQQVNDLCDRLKAAQTAGRNARAIVTLIIFLVVAWFAWTTYAVFDNLWKSRGRTVDWLLSQADVVMKPLERDVALMGKNLYPVYLDETRAMLNKDWPDMKKKLQAEADLLVNNVSGSIDKKIDRRLTLAQERLSRRLLAAFPELGSGAKLEPIVLNLRHAIATSFMDAMETRVARGANVIGSFQRKLALFLPEQRRAEFENNLTEAWDIIAKSAPAVVEK